jgi:hypothetical protein
LKEIKPFVTFIAFCHHPPKPMHVTDNQDLITALFRHAKTAFCISTILAKQAQRRNTVLCKHNNVTNLTHIVPAGVFEATHCHFNLPFHFLSI